MDNYEILGQIGKGSFGLVQKIKRKSDGKVLVWKEMNYGRMSEREKQQLVAEVNIIRELKHPNIVRYYDRIIEKKDTKIFIIMEYCEGGDVGTLLKKCKKEKDYIAEDVIWKIFTQIILALNECHNRPQGKILHRDLKPANIFLDAQNNIKLGDFGLSRVMGEQSEFADTHVGTPYYMSPEQIQEKKYNEKSDIWSAGCLLYEMAALKPPFEATNHLSLAIKIKSGKFERLPLRYSEELQKLIESMVHIDPEKRPSVQNILELPQISLRLKERKLREKHSQIKIKEDELKKREEQLQERIDQIEKKEKDFTIQEQALKDLEEQVKQLEAQLNIRSSQTSLQQSEEDVFQRQDKQLNNNNNNAGMLPQKSARGEYQLLSQNLNSFGKDLMMLNKGSVENNSSGSSSKNSTATASNNTFELFKKEKENMINNGSNIQSNLQSIENYRKEKEIQKQLQSYSSNKYPIFQKSNSSIVSQSLTDQQMQLQQQNSQDTTSSQVVQQQSSENNQSNLKLRSNIAETQSSCSSNSSNNEVNASNSIPTNAKDKNYTLYQRREQEAFQKTPNNNGNQHQNYHTLNRQGEMESVTKKNTSYSKDHQYKSVDHFTSIQNNNNSSSKKDESTAFSTTCKQIPQSASQNQNIANQSSNKSSHKSSSENLPKKSGVASSSSAANSNQNENQNQENTSAASNNIINNTGMSAFERYKASILQQQQQQQNQINNGYQNKYAQMKSKVRQASQDSMDDNEQQIGNNNYTSKLHTQQPVSSKLRAQTSIDSVSVKQNQDNKNYLLNYKKDAPSGSSTSAATITRRSANTTIDSVKYSQINNSSNMQGATSNNNQNASYEIYKQANIKRTDSYKENTFKNIMQQNSNINKQQEVVTPSSSNNNQQIHSSTTLAQNQKNFQKNRSSLEPKNRFHSQHSTTQSSSTTTAIAQTAQQQQQQSSSQVALNSNKPPITMMNNNGAQNGNGNNNEDVLLNFKTLPNTEFQYDSNNVNKMQIKKKNNNSFTTTSQNISNSYLNSNNNYINNQPRSTTNSNTIGNNSARINNTEQSIERKKEFPRPRNNYLLPSSKQTLNINQNQEANIKNYFSEQPNNLMTVQTDQLYNKYNLRKIGDNIISPTVQHISSNQYRTTTQY
ncbi:hypothetical protein ABPG74_022860 [Tetrahymena malaccensis]